jgi:hypothetical protein
MTQEQINCWKISKRGKKAVINRHGTYAFGSKPGVFRRFG